MKPFLAATAQYPVTCPGSWGEVEQHIAHWVETAAGQGAELLVFPEYAAMSLAALLPPPVQSDLAAQLVGLQSLREEYLALHRRLARSCGVHLLAGSFPWQIEGERFCNRAWLCGPKGEAGFQDKQVMTRFEREHWMISRGELSKVFDTALGKIGVAICYDAEFPLLTRAHCEAGAEILLVPSCTDALAGYHRVRVAAQARALEGQCYVLLSPLVGDAPWSPAVDRSIGGAGIFGPPDMGFPDDGVIAAGRLNEPTWVYGEIDCGRVHRVRSDGQVLNHRHWPESVAVEPARSVSL